jgi:hypothetical protein
MGTAVGALSLFHTPIDGVKTSLNSAFGTTTAFIKTKALDIGDARLSYNIDEIITHLTDNKNLQQMVLEIYGSDEESGPFVLLDTIDLSLEEPGYTDPPGMRYYELIFRDNAVNQRWKLHGFDIYGEPGGEEF